MMEQRDVGSPQGEPSKKKGGGSAFGGGARFQTDVTAIVGVHILRGAPLGWLEAVCNDVPVAVWAESEGPGDDLRIELIDDGIVEIQAKKGLDSRKKLFAALLPICIALYKGEFSYGILAVASDSLSTIKNDLANDIERRGQGRTDRPSAIGEAFFSLLTSAAIPAEEVCRCLRIRSIDTLISDNRDINAAKSGLRNVCEREEDTPSAWDALYNNAARLIENRGRWTLRDLVRLLKSRDIPIRNDDLPASLLNRHAQWVCSANKDFSIPGIKPNIGIEHLLPMHLVSEAFEQINEEDVSSALARYQTIPEHPSLSKRFDSVWTARFKTRAVVVAGPGLGKSTMLKELAYQYALDGFVVLSAQLRWIAAGIKNGGVFFDLLMSSSISSSGIPASKFANAKRFNWVVLLDGLDECGNSHREIAEEIHRFSLGHPDARIVVTTRPIGYTKSSLSDWDHYRLLPPVMEDGAENLKKLVNAISPDKTALVSSMNLQSRYKRPGSPSDAFSISPQLLGMSAALICRNRVLPNLRLELYSELIRLFEEVPMEGRAESIDIAVTVLNIAGWHLIETPLINSRDLINRTSLVLAALIDKTHLVSKGYVRTALDHWKRVGLVETFFHNDVEFIAFIHKTFCEFVASRFLLDQSEAVVESVVDQPRMREVITFSIGLGLADKLIAIYLRRAESGQPQQLDKAIALLAQPEAKVSDKQAIQLIERSLKAIDDGASDRFIIGKALCEVRFDPSDHLRTAAQLRIQSDDPAIRLVAWALVIQGGVQSADAAAALRNLAPTVPPSDIVRILRDKQDRSDLDLLRKVALGALKAQTDLNARHFAEHELKGKFFSNLDLMLHVDLNLSSRGLETLPPVWEPPEPNTPAVSVQFAGPSFREASLIGGLAIAKAFADATPTVSAKRGRERTYPQLGGFLRASGYLSSPSSDLFAWAGPHDELAVKCTLRYVASLLSLDLNELTQESTDILQVLESAFTTNQSLFDIVPALDIPEVCWDCKMEDPLHREEIKQAILHPSDWLNQLATNICKRIPMLREELETLLNATSGYSMRCVTDLIVTHHPDSLVEMLWERLKRDATGDMSSIFEVFQLLDVSPNLHLVELTLLSLCSDDERTCESAAEFLGYLLDKGYRLDKARVEEAVAHWGGRDQGTMAFQTPLHSIIELSDKIDA